MIDDFVSIKGYEGFYSINSNGDVLSLKRKVKTRCGFRFVKEKIISQYKENSGYMSVCLSKNHSKKTFHVHSLVALAFLGERNGLHINHIDGNKTNNKLDNLEYVTPSQNSIHAVKLGLMPSQIGSKNPSSKLIECQVRDIKVSIKRGVSNLDIAKKYNISPSLVSLIKNGHRWPHVILD